MMEHKGNWSMALSQGGDHGLGKILIAHTMRPQFGGSWFKGPDISSVDLLSRAA
jgi:hypothetical protein